MRKTLLTCALTLSTLTLPAQTDTLTVTSTLVVVPTLVRSPGGALQHTLSAADFTLLDNGIPQHLTLEQPDRQPVAIVVLLQIGGAAARQFDSYANLPTMLDYLAGSSPHKFALVTFDSQPEEEWSFTPNTSDLAAALTHPDPGDHKAALFDAIHHGIGMLQQQPANTRRILVLLSQPQDEGSHAHVEDIVRSLGENNVTIYSITFSPQKDWLKDQFTKPRQGEPPYQMSPNQAPIIGTFSLSKPLGVAMRALQTNAAAEVASLSGGESLGFSDKSSLEHQLATVANHIPNRYMLTFRPSSNQPGFHTLQLQLPSHPDLTISARTSYWSGELSPANVQK